MMLTEALYERHAQETDLKLLLEESPRLYIKFFWSRDSVHESGGREG
jgi:hypothetical protein